VKASRLYHAANLRTCEKKQGLQVPVPPEPLNLRSRVPVNDIALVVLEAPGDNDKDVPLPDPDFLLDLTLDPAHPGDPVKAPYPDMIGAHHQFGAGKYLPVPLVRETYPDDLLGFSRPLLVGQYINSTVPCFASAILLHT
jgi:hypothetical protein